MDIPLPTFFGRVGGKRKLAKYIITKIPAEFNVYVEPFVGGGSVFFGKTLSKTNVINDIVTDITDVFCDLREIDDLDFLKMDTTNVSKEEFLRLKEKHTFDNIKDRFFRNMFLTKNSYRGDKVSYAWSEKYFGGKIFKSQVACVGLKKNFKNYQYKLKNTIILNKDYKDVIKEYDSDETFFYIDPPYSQNFKSWSYDTPYLSKEEIRDELRKIKGKFLMSYNYSDENLDFFKEFYIEKVETFYTISTGKRKTKEILIANYPLKTS